VNQKVWKILPTANSMTSYAADFLEEATAIFLLCLNSQKSGIM